MNTVTDVTLSIHPARTAPAAGRPPQSSVPDTGIAQSLISLAISVPGTMAIALLIKATSAPGSWAYEFFYHRRFVQWIIVWMCVHGLVDLARRVPAWLRERRGLRRWQTEGAPGAGAGLVSERYERLRQLVACAAVADTRAGARRLAEEAAALLDARYAAVNVLTHLASYCGFFGTVLGLSIGLFQAFGSQGILSVKSFGAAVSTSFDTTLSGVACTILLIMVQSLLRSREEAVLTGTDRLAGEVLLRHEQELADSLGVSGQALAPQNQAELYGRTVELIAGQMREMTAASQSLARQSQALLESLVQAVGAVRTENHQLTTALAQTTRELQATVAGGEAIRQTVAALQTELNAGLARTTAQAADQGGQLAAVGRQAEQLAAKLADLRDLVGRPRQLQIIETV